MNFGQFVIQVYEVQENIKKIEYTKATDNDGKCSTIYILSKSLYKRNT